MLVITLLLIMAGLVSNIGGLNEAPERDAVDYAGVLRPGIEENLPSPTGRFTAAFEAFDDRSERSGYRSVRGYRLKISRRGEEDSPIYAAEVEFYACFANFVVWAEDEDVLWAYNSDIGVFYWTVDEKGVWTENILAKNRDAEIPDKLIELRPRFFNNIHHD